MIRAKEFRNQISLQVRQGRLVEPRCAHAGECGGCAFQDRLYADQVAAKGAIVAQLFHAAGIALPDGDTGRVVPSPDPYSYRTRMDYVTTKGRFGLRARGKFNYVIDLHECHLIPPTAFATARAIWVAACELGLPDYNMRSHEGFMRYIVVRRSPTDALLIAMVTAAGHYDAEMEQLATIALAQPGVVGFHWLLNDTLTDLSFGTVVRSWGAALLSMEVGTSRLAIGPNTFFQNNVHLLGRLLEDVRLAAMGVSETPRVADLYGGVGTIALYLAPFSASVACVEAVAESAALAVQNAAEAGITNVRSSAQEVLPFLREQAVGSYDAIVVDPPRTGMGTAVCTELLRLQPQRLIYISCNPLTQIEDLRHLASGYRLTSFQSYDMFPHTPHLETLALLDRG